MRKIKFRGIDTVTGKYVYGDFVHYVPMSTFNGIVDEDGFVHEIKFGSERQLTGYDKHGREVYVGDKVRMIHNGKEYVYTAHMKGFATTADGCYIPSEKFSERELVEAST